MPQRSRSPSGRRVKIIDRGADGRDKTRDRRGEKKRAASDSGDDRDNGKVRGWSREREDHGDRSRAASIPAAAAMGAGSMKKIRKDIYNRELGYKDESNPFGDVTLSNKFIWKKKNEYLSAAGLYKKTSKDQEVERTEAKIREIHQVKKRRDEREVERQLLEQQRLEHDKDMKDELYGDFVDKEEQFHLENAKTRSLIRIEQGRERPIDLVAKSLSINEGDEYEDMTVLDKAPHQLFVAMSLQETEENITEIETFIKNDSQHKSFWKALKYCGQDALEQKTREKAGRAKAGATLSGLGAGVAEGVASDIHELLSSKGKDELHDMLMEIKGNLSVGSAGMDTQFFDAVASKIPLYMARAEVEETHNKAKKKSEKWFEDHAAMEDAADAKSDASSDPDLAAADEAGTKTPEPSDWADLPTGFKGDHGQRMEEDDLSPQLEPLSVLEEERRGPGACSPILEPISGFDPEDLLDPEEDERILRQVRRTLIDAFSDPAAGGASSSAGLDRSADDAMVAQERAKGFGNEEIGFNAAGKGTGDDFHGEMALPVRHYEWEDKYAPRKPRFFNRVKTGYEWNKYNQTHYDHDNPPPKMVQGYKFNIFYPDLIDKGKAPAYYIEKSDSSDTATLRFHAGPPYEDVAFKIVSREWNLSHKFGFRVVFDRGVLQLYFNFKRHRYRR